MATTDNKFVATGAAAIGFATSSTSIINGAIISGNSLGVEGRCLGAAGNGVYGVGTGTGGAGAYGASHTLNGNGVIAAAHSGNNSYGIWASSTEGYSGRFDGKVRINGELLVVGAKSAVVASPDGTLRRLYALESPESYFEDFGFGRLVGGRAEIVLDDTFAAITSNDPYHVFITEYEDNNSLYVAMRTNTGFEVRSKTSTGNGEFSYRVVAKRNDIPTSRFQVVEELEKRLEDITEPSAGE
ncbi:hypothetical protein ACFVZZ_31285 [Streptomyces chartreusis]|uniref:hypothetical protein n=1 Tax=Streptomyces chartreusis TaxID=1969 RepID=UPI0036D87319